MVVILLRDHQILTFAHLCESDVCIPTAHESVIPFWHGSLDLAIVLNIEPFLFSPIFYST